MQEDAFMLQMKKRKFSDPQSQRYHQESSGIGNLHGYLQKKELCCWKMTGYCH